MEYFLIAAGIVVLILWQRDLRIHADARRYKRKGSRRSESGSSGHDGSVPSNFKSEDASYDGDGGDFGGGGASGSWGDSGGGGDGGGGGGD